MGAVTQALNGAAGEPLVGQEMYVSDAFSMTTGISLKAAGNATSLFPAITFVLGVAFDLLVPSHAM